MKHHDRKDREREMWKREQERERERNNMKKMEEREKNPKAKKLVPYLKSKGIFYHQSKIWVEFICFYLPKLYLVSLTKIG